jgi:hypothetical protein
MSMPKRIQRKRTKGWKMPPNTVSVTRPGVFGNPMTLKNAVEASYLRDKRDPRANKFLADCFRDWITDAGDRGGRDWWQGPESDARKAEIKRRLPTLRGKDLACYCRLDQACHADVLLELANKP